MHPGGGLARQASQAGTVHGLAPVCLSILRLRAGHSLILCKATKGKAHIMAHTTWLRSGKADAPDSPFQVLQLEKLGLNNAGGQVRHRRYPGLHSRSDSSSSGSESDSEPPAIAQLEGQTLPDASLVFKDPSLPLIIDVGCGPGRSLLLAAHGFAAGSHHHEQDVFQATPDSFNFLGLDVHVGLVERANRWSSALGHAHHVAYLALDARTTLTTLLANYPGAVAMVSVQCPDPHIRVDRHVVTPDFVRDVVHVLQRGGSRGPDGGSSLVQPMVLLTSDVLGTAEHMRHIFAAHSEPPGVLGLHPLHTDPSLTGAVWHHTADHPDTALGGASKTWRTVASKGLGQSVSTSQPTRTGGITEGISDSSGLVEHVDWSSSGWLTCNPLAPSEREVYTQTQLGLPVYRVLLQLQQQQH